MLGRGWWWIFVALELGCLVRNPGFKDEGGGESLGAGETAGEAGVMSTSTDAPTSSMGESAGATSTGTTSTGTTGTTHTEVSETTGCDQAGLYFLDEDGDGFGAGEGQRFCEMPAGWSPLDGDCDDTSAMVSPGAIELCSGHDDDCDGLIDEASALNATCDGCELAELEGHAYWFCAAELPWAEARAFCAAREAELVILETEVEHAFVLEAVDQTQVHWIGASDVDPGPALDYRWVNGAAMVDAPWSPGDPNHDNGCAILAAPFGAQLRDRGCEIAYPFVCEGVPAP